MQFNIFIFHKITCAFVKYFTLHIADFWRGCALPFLISVEHNNRYYNTGVRGRRDGQIDRYLLY